MFNSFFRRLAASLNIPVPTPVIPPPVVREKTIGPVVAIINKSTVIKDPDLAAAVAAIQVQVDRDFAPVWEMGANLIIVAPDKVPPVEAWIIYVLDNSDEEGALGYHEITPTGMPIGKVFAGDDLKYNLSWSVTLSHELLEMLADPYIDTCVFEQTTDTAGTLYAYEVCDAVEDDQFGYKIGDVLVSDFVYPTWFESFRSQASTQFSFRNAVNAPFTLAEGGYISYFEVSPDTKGWQQATPDAGIGARLAKKGADSRKALRSTPFTEVSVVVPPATT